MKRNLQLIAVPAAIAASFLVGCGSPRIVARTDPRRPSIVQVSEGYDTVGRKWEDQAPKPAPQPVVYQPVYQPIYQATESKILTRNEVEIRSFTGTITDIDHPGREMTLKDAEGKSVTFSVSTAVQRFDQAKVGDKVSLDYYFGFNAEVRKPTADELENPLVVLQATGRSGPNEAPSGSDTKQIRAVVTIEGLDRADQTLTVKGPRGQYYIARVADPSRFDDVKIGDTIVMTFTESMAVSLTPAN